MFSGNSRRIEGEHMQRSRLQNRRGVMLVLAAFMFVVFIGAAAFAVDVGRMYLYRSQLSTAADAAALAGAFKVLKKELLPDSAVSSAQYFARRHRAGTDSVTLDAADVVPGVWTLGGGFVASVWNDAAVNAVQVTTRYTG